MGSSDRRVKQNRVDSTPVTITLENDLREMIDELVTKRVFKNRSFAINEAVKFLRWTLQTNPGLFYDSRHPKIQPESQPQQDTDLYYPD